MVHFHNLFPLLTPAALREARLGSEGSTDDPQLPFCLPRRDAAPRRCDPRGLHRRFVAPCGLRNTRGKWSESVAYGIAIEAQRRLRLLHRWVDAYVAPSDSSLGMLVRAGYPRRPHSCDSPRHADRQDTPSAPGDYALYAGRLSSEKGVETLLAASRGISCPARHRGGGPLDPASGRPRPKHSDSSVRSSKDEVGDLLRRALFTIAPSNCYEVQPFGVLESLAAGRPVIASRLGGLAEIVQDGVTGDLVPANDPAALAAAMERLWDDRALAAEMGANAWAYAKENFSPP